MAVQIPSIQRIAPQAPTSVGRIQTQLPDGTKAFAQTSAQIVQAGKTVIKQVNKVEGQTIDLESIKMRNKYKLEYRKALVDLKSWKGDPTEKFAALDKMMNKLGRDMLDQSSMKSSRARDAFEKSLLNADNSMQLERYTLSGQMHSIYKDSVYDEGVKEESRQSTVNVGYVKSGDESTLVPFQGNLTEMRNLRTSRSAELGTAQEVPLDYSPKKGEMTHRVAGKKYILDDVTKNDIAAKESNAIYKSIDTLLAVGKAPELKNARYMMDNYENRLEAKDKSRLNRRFGEVGKETQALQIAASLRSLTPPERQKKIDAITDLEVASEVRKIVNTREKVQKSSKDTYAADVYDRNAKTLDDRQRGANKYQTVHQYQQSEMFKADRKWMSDKQTQALYQKIEQPKTSNQAQITKLNDMIIRGEFVEMTATELDVHLVGLSLVDRGRFQGILRKYNLIESDVQLGSRLRNSMRNLRQLGLSSHVIPSKGDRGLVPTKEGAIMLNELQRELTLKFDQTSKFSTAKDDIIAYKEILARADINKKHKKLSIGESIQKALIPSTIFGIKVPGAFEERQSIIEAIPNLDRLGRLKAGELSRDFNKPATQGEPAPDIKPRVKLSKKKRSALYIKFRESNKKGADFNKWLREKGF